MKKKKEEEGDLSSVVHYYCHSNLLVNVGTLYAEDIDGIDRFTRRYLGAEPCHLFVRTFFNTIR